MYKCISVTGLLLRFKSDAVRIRRRTNLKEVILKILGCVGRNVANSTLHERVARYVLVERCGYVTENRNVERSSVELNSN